MRGSGRYIQMVRFMTSKGPSGEATRFSSSIPKDRPPALTCDNVRQWALRPWARVDDLLKRSLRVVDGRNEVNQPSRS
jgi:hypothetical protein